MLPVPIRRENTPRYVRVDNCDGCQLSQALNRNVIEERMPPGASEVRRFHRNAQQFFSFYLAKP
jgi:hypothetical protein